MGYKRTPPACLYHLPSMNGRGAKSDYVTRLHFHNPWTHFSQSPPPSWKLPPAASLGARRPRLAGLVEGALSPPGGTPPWASIKPTWRYPLQGRALSPPGCLSLLTCRKRVWGGEKWRVGAGAPSPRPKSTSAARVCLSPKKGCKSCIIRVENTLPPPPARGESARGRPSLRGRVGFCPAVPLRQKLGSRDDFQ